ncbi:MAG: ImmA/IrrE family metallo-endopeptidase [Brevundimonas sp.]
MRVSVEIDRLSDDIYRSAHLDPSEPAPPNALCRHLFGRVPEFARINCDASVALVRGQWRLFVRRGLPVSRLRFAVLHEVAHIIYWGCGMVHDDLEARCNRLGAALAVPRLAFLRAAHRSHDVAHLAEAFGATQSLVLLRWGECEGKPIALIEPSAVHTRGRKYPWPDEHGLRLLAHDCRWPGARVHLTDAPMRIGLLAS